MTQSFYYERVVACVINCVIQVSHFPTPRIIWGVKLNNLR
jgi:hypothetical protein